MNNPYATKQWIRLQTATIIKQEVVFVKNEKEFEFPAYGWFVEIDGNFYGNHVLLDKENLAQEQTNSQAIKDVMVLLHENATVTVDQIINKKQKKVCKK